MNLPLQQAEDFLVGFGGPDPIDPGFGGVFDCRN